MSPGFRLTGTCVSTSECQRRSGALADGSCAAGFGTCCVLRTTGCNLEVSLNSSHVMNPGHPASTTASATCQYRLTKLGSDICFFRLDFISLSLDTPVTSSNWDCSKDKVGRHQDVILNSQQHSQLVFTTPSSRAPPTICGYNTGQHLYLDASYNLDGLCLVCVIID